ncbi:Rieske (2Fe-2S) protein [Streptomyces sp. NPDC002265]|uniref:Rieske (2Fe-2S) protein n=1 Tax=Streptomyces sp. NPDC002265 TaxID=3154415 RepID=UPI0033239AFA
MTHGPTRRTVLATGAAACVAGCSKSGGNGSSGSASATSPTASSTASAASPAATSTAMSATGSAAGSAAAGKELAKTADIPVGGGTIFAAEMVVVTQPEKGEFKAFSNICTHRQCPVANVSDGTINCTCHGSRFSITDGSVAHPPATQPLPEKKITVEGDAIRLV